MAELADGNRERIWRVLGNAYSSPTFSRIWEERIETMVAEIATEHVTAALDEIETVVAAQREAFLPSPNLDPSWIAGWHAAVDHVSHAVRGHRQEQDR